MTNQFTVGNNYYFSTLPVLTLWSSFLQFLQGIFQRWIVSVFTHVTYGIAQLATHTPAHHPDMWCWFEAAALRVTTSDFTDVQPSVWRLRGMNGTCAATTPKHCRLATQDPKKYRSWSTDFCMEANVKQSEQHLIAIYWPCIEALFQSSFNTNLLRRTRKQANITWHPKANKPFKKKSPEPWIMEIYCVKIETFKENFRVKINI